VVKYCDYNISSSFKSHSEQKGEPVTKKQEKALLLLSEMTLRFYRLTEMLQDRGERQRTIDINLRIYEDMANQLRELIYEWGEEK
jgi:hypothetical protein